MNILNKDKSLRSLEAFCDIDSKDNIIKVLDNIIRYSIVSGMLREYNLEDDINFLFEIKDMMQQIE